MSAVPAFTAPPVPEFCQGVQYYGEPWPGFEQYALQPAIRPGRASVEDASDTEAAFQTLLGADALRYLALQITGTKASGHPGGFASSAEVYAALVMLGHTNIITEAGHHAPGFYAAMFLDTSLEEMGIRTVQELCDRFRERHGLLGHISGAIPGILSPAGPLGQGQHFAMAAALLHPDILFPLTLGDGGLGEPYIFSSILHFHTAYPRVTNFLPALIWNGYSQEHHSMVSRFSNQEMVDYWKGSGFGNVILVDAKDFDDQGQEGAYVDSTRFSLPQRLAFAQAVLEGLDRASKSARAGMLTAFIIKQLKGAGLHTVGAKSHNLGPGDTLANPQLVEAMYRRALNPEAWPIVRENFRRAGGGPVSKTSVIESVLPLPVLGELPKREFALGDKQTPTGAVAALVKSVGGSDPRFVVTNADGNAASGLQSVNQALRIRHPSEDLLYDQGPDGQVYEPVNEDACAGLAAGLALFGGRSLWVSYEAFAINGLPIWQTVAQAMAELRRPTPSAIALFTACALEQNRNGWTHQRPEIENYFAAMTRNGNIFPIFPCDANVIQIAYEWALATNNKGVIITASKSPLPVYTTFEQAREAITRGAVSLYESPNGGKKTVVFAVVGDMVLGTVFEAKDVLEREGFAVRIVSVVNPRRLYRPTDVAWETVFEPDDLFLDNRSFSALFDADLLLGVTAGPSGVLEPVMLRSQAARRDVFCWKRGDTSASPAELLESNSLTAGAMANRVRTLAAETSNRNGSGSAAELQFAAHRR